MNDQEYRTLLDRVAAASAHLDSALSELDGLLIDLAAMRKLGQVHSRDGEKKIH